MKVLRKHFLFVTVTAVLLCIFSSNTVLADKTVDSGKRGSVTIRYFDDVDSKTPVAGAEFTFYKIDDSSDLTTYTDTTNQDGIMKISDMKLGRYRVVETSPSPGHKASSSFLLTIPMTDHNEWLYDLTLEPKASLDLPTTSKSVYSFSGIQNTSSILSGSNYQGHYTGTGLTSSRSTRSETSQVGHSQDRSARRAVSARTGDESGTEFWTVLNICSAIAITVLSLAAWRRTPAHEFHN